MIHVGLGEIRFAVKPETLKTIGLGSCVGLVVYGEFSGIAGMAHVMLPDSSLAGVKAFLPGKFADTAVAGLVHDLHNRYGLDAGLLKAKIAGGAEMFRSSRPQALAGIGRRNVLAVKEHLNRFRIPLVAEQTGEHFGRTIEFFTESGRLVIHSIQRGETVI